MRQIIRQGYVPATAQDGTAHEEVRLRVELLGSSDTGHEPDSVVDITMPEDVEFVESLRVDTAALVEFLTTELSAEPEAGQRWVGHAFGKHVLVELRERVPWEDGTGCSWQGVLCFPYTGDCAIPEPELRADWRRMS